MIFQLDIPIYNTNILFIINPIKDEMDEFLNNENNKEKLTEEEFTNLFKELDDKRYGGYTTALDKGGYLILIKEGYKYFTNFVHELFHVANLVLFDREVEYSRTFEPLAYLLGWMTQQYADYVLWKPTEEQLQTLHAQLNEGAVTYPDDKRVLTTLYEDLMKITTQEEKQVEQKETLCDKCRKEQPSHSCQDITELGRCALEHEQKPADKVEPKFHEGDWVVYNNGNTYQVEEISDKRYELIDNFGDNLSVPMCWEKSLRLWTIEDAKDGDVLVSGEVIFIFNLIHGIWLNCHCSLHKDGSFNDVDYDLMTSRYFDEVYPATKEQRDLLFQKMKEAGYEWNADKKELKKIEPCLGCINDKGCINCENGSLKETEKSAWSEEDKEQLDRAIYMMGQLGLTKSWDDVYNWLKSLKDRI